LNRINYEKLGLTTNHASKHLTLSGGPSSIEREDIKTPKESLFTFEAAAVSSAKEKPISSISTQKTQQPSIMYEAASIFNTIREEEESQY
jgi:hypothetical protein